MGCFALRCFAQSVGQQYWVVIIGEARMYNWDKVERVVGMIGREITYSGQRCN